MDNIVQFRVVIDHEDDVFRDIEIRTDQSFEALHLAIQQAFGFDDSQMASFYQSNDNWDKGEEIGLMDMAEEGMGFRTMAHTLVGDVISEPGQKMVYVFDFLLMWCFYLEVLQLGQVKQGIVYPRTVHTFGVNIDQYSREPDASMPAEDLEGLDAGDLEGLDADGEVETEDDLW